MDPHRITRQHNPLQDHPVRIAAPQGTCKHRQLSDVKTSELLQKGVSPSILIVNVNQRYPSKSSLRWYNLKCTRDIPVQDIWRFALEGMHTCGCYLVRSCLSLSLQDQDRQRRVRNWAIDCGNGVLSRLEEAFHLKLGSALLVRRKDWLGSERPASQTKLARIIHTLAIFHSVLFARYLFEFTEQFCV